MCERERERDRKSVFEIRPKQLKIRESKNWERKHMTFKKIMRLKS